jgi:hypothetical protein
VQGRLPYKEDERRCTSLLPGLTSAVEATIGGHGHALLLIIKFEKLRKLDYPIYKIRVSDFSRFRIELRKKVKQGNLKIQIYLKHEKFENSSLKMKS